MFNTIYERLIARVGKTLVIFSTVIFMAACGSSTDDSGDESTNSTPIADAGDSQSVITGELVSLDGSASSDADGDTLSYSWVVSTEDDYDVSLTDASTATPSFTPDTDGTYTVELTVNDGTVDSSTDTISIISSETGTSVTETYAIVDTNQNVCYDSSDRTSGGETCSNDGYDGDYSGNQPSYTVSDDGATVTDNVTGLIWQQSTDYNNDGSLDYDDKMYQPAAVSYCEDLTLGGRDDWRLPSVKEAYSLILFSGTDASNYSGEDTSVLTPFISDVFDWAFGDLDATNNGDTDSDGDAISDRIIDGQYASTTIYESTTMNGNTTVFGVNYVDGRIKGYPYSTKQYYVRCVTDNTDYGTNDFEDNADSTVTDHATGLMWQQDDSASTDWDDAVETCEAADTAGYSDWRLPNVKELHSLVDYTKSPDTSDDAAIDGVFNSTSLTNEEGIEDWGYYWSSTTHVNYGGVDGTNAAYVSFGRALGYMNSTILDVHGAGSQRSNDKLDVENEAGASSVDAGNGTFYYKGPQGDILRIDNKVRCVRDDDSDADEIEEYTLFTPFGSNDTYLIDDEGDTVHTWTSAYKPGLSVYLNESGELLRPGRKAIISDPFDGETSNNAGVVEVLDWDGTSLWSTTLSTTSYLSHHDVEELLNGNILAIVWEAKTEAEALALGRTSVSDGTLWADAVYEICRASDDKTCTDGEIVWRWSTWDNVVQDQYSSISTYVADISANNHKIDLNYFTGLGAADWTHANAVDYNATTDEILLSVRGFSEYWVIDHSAASGSSDGILSRVGNPAAYGDDVSEQTLFVQHDAQWIADGLSGAGNILVFNNGTGRSDGDYSSVDEFCYPDDGSCTVGSLVDSYSEGASGDFYADHISGAQRLEDGDTLVCVGTEAYFFEYDSSGEITWEYTYPNGNEIFRATRYNGDYAGLSDLN